MFVHGTLTGVVGANQGPVWPGMARLGAARHDRNRRGMTRRGKARQGISCTYLIRGAWGRSRQGKARQGSARLGLARQGISRKLPIGYLIRPSRHQEERMKSTQENQKARAVLQSYFERQADGETLSWLDIEQATGVKMDPPGRNRVRVVLNSLKRPFESIRGSGIRLSSPNTINTIVAGRGKSVGNAIKRWSKTIKHGTVRHLSAMEGDDKDRLINAASFAGALEGVMSNATKALVADTKELPKADPKKIALVH